jgi:uncharacterized protein (DUF697 family)
MKTRIYTALVAALLGNVTSAFAASGAREDNSGILVWVFLGMCALIVVLQLVPAVMTMVGAAKGVAESMAKKAEVRS